MSLFVTNNTDQTIHMRSFDGNSVAIHAKSRRVQVADKFEWQYPSTLVVVKGPPDAVDPTRVVAGQAVTPVKTPKGWHNKGREAPLMTAAQMREKAARKREMRDAKLAAATQAPRPPAAPAGFGAGPAPSQVAAAAGAAKTEA